MAQIFISYSSEDKTLVSHLAGLLANKGWSVWWDRQIPIGQKFDEVIERELKEAKCVLVVWTQRSISSEWVKNEASEAAQMHKLIPILLENLQVPMSFKRVEAARLIGWQGESDHPELELLYLSISNLILGIDHSHEALDAPADRPHDYQFKRTNSQFLKYGILASMVVLLIVLGVVYSSNKTASHNVTIRVYDWKKNPIPQGEVKIYLNEYIRSQSIDNMGQALLSGIPIHIFKQLLKVEISSPGYATKRWDTIIQALKPMEFMLPFTTKIIISGHVKTAAEIPIKDVEINVEGTRYVTKSITDGSYQLRLEEYTLGDNISITTSHKKFEDKTFSLKINSAEINNYDIFLNPVQH